MGRRDKSIAKKEIYAVFCDFIKSGNTKATISSVVEATGMNRKTFYNHFSSRDELVAWGFRYDLLQTLLRHHEFEELSEPLFDQYEFENLPCYYRNTSTSRSLDQSQYFCDFYDVIREHKDYYRPLLRSDLALPFSRYLVELLRGLFYEDIDLFLNGRKMPQDAMCYISGFYAEGVVHHVVDSLSGTLLPSIMPRRNIEEISHVNNLVHEAMYSLVEAYQNEKSYKYFTQTRSL